MKREKAEKLLQNNPKLGLYSKKLGEIRSLFCNGDNSVFAEKLGVSTAYTSSLCNAKEPITQRTLEKILKIFPDVSPAWLYLDEGEMLRTDNSNQGGTVGENSGIIVQHGDNSTYNNNSDLLSVVHAQQETISRQSDTIATLTETNRQQSEQIGKLIEMLSLK